VSYENNHHYQATSHKASPKAMFWTKGQPGGKIEDHSCVDKMMLSGSSLGHFMQVL